MATYAAPLSWIQENVLPGATRAALPKGAMMNYLSRHLPQKQFWQVVILGGNTAEQGVGCFDCYQGHGTKLMNGLRTITPRAIRRRT